MWCCCLTIGWPRMMKATLEGVRHLIIEDKVRRRLPAVVGKCVRIGGHHVLFRRLHLISSLLNTVYKCKTYGYQRCIIWYIFNVDKLMNQSIYQWLPYLTGIMWVLGWPQQRGAWGSSPRSGGSLSSSGSWGSSGYLRSVFSQYNYTIECVVFLLFGEFSYACSFDRLCKVQKKGWVKKTRKGAL